MKKNQQSMQALIFEGPILKVLIFLGLPIVISYVVNCLYVMGDTYFISLIDTSSTAEISGTGLLYPLEFIFEAAASSIAVGLSVLVGRYIGGNKIKEAEKLGINALVIGLVCSIPFVIICYIFGPDIVNLLGGNGLSAEARGYAVSYLYSIAPGIVFMVLSQIIGGILVGQGLASVTTKGFMFMTIFNFIGDPILMFAFNLSVVGAGLSTSFSLLLSFLYVLVYCVKGKAMLKPKFKFSDYDINIVKKILAIGMPQLLMTCSLYLITIVFNKVILNHFTENVMEAWTLVGRIDQILNIPIIAVSSAAMVLISQNFGCKNSERIKKALNISLAFVFCLCTIIAVVYSILAPLLFSNFTTIDEIISLAKRQVAITSLTSGFMAISWVVGSFFQATGKPMPALGILYIRAALILGLGLILINVSGFGVYVIFVSIALGNVITAVIGYVFAKSYVKGIAHKGFKEAAL